MEKRPIISGALVSAADGSVGSDPIVARLCAVMGTRDYVTVRRPNRPEIGR
jgi:hypothetical protein